MAGLSMSPYEYDTQLRSGPPPSTRDALGQGWRYKGQGIGWQEADTPEMRYQRERDAARQSLLQSMTAQIGGFGGGGGGGSSFTMPPPPTPTTYGGGTPPARVGGPKVAAVAPANSEAFGRAKDASSRIHGQALEGLKDQMTARGISGSGVESRATGDLIADAARYQSDAELAQQIEAQRQAWEAAKGSHTGDITQRGQDIGAADAAAKNALASYDASIQAWNTQVQAMLAQQRLQQEQQELALRPWLAMMSGMMQAY